MSRTTSAFALKKTMAPTDKNPLSETAALTGTLELLEQFRRGDARARDLLVERSLPSLRKWARGRGSTRHYGQALRSLIGYSNGQHELLQCTYERYARRRIH